MSRTLSLDSSVIEDMRNDCGITHLVKRPGYVKGEFNDDSPFSALLWQDLRRSCRIMRISEYAMFIFEWYLDGFSDADIAGFCVSAGYYAVSPGAVRISIMRTKQKLLKCRSLGMLTVVYEQCGGWQAIRELLSGSG